MATIKAEMAGTLVEYRVKVGDKVASGDEIAILESMKMEVPVTATQDGVIKELRKAAGDFVNAGDVLAELG